VENTLHIFFIWMHIIGIALWLGPQVFLAFAWVPASRGITDRALRLQAMRTITSRFAWIGGTGLLLLLIAGTYLISDWRDFYAIPEDAGFTDFRYGVIFIVKMSVLLVMLIITGLHTFVLGPRLLDAIERDASEDELRSRRMQSMFASIAVLLLTLVIIVLGTMLGTPSYSLQDA
jgi:uncharacterized membrane protein